MGASKEFKDVRIEKISDDNIKHKIVVVVLLFSILVCI